VVRCHRLGLTYNVAEEHSDRARWEGWIALPVPESLSRLGEAGRRAE
jgi:hypothetical protein